MPFQTGKPQVLQLRTDVPFDLEAQPVSLVPVTRMELPAATIPDLPAYAPKCQVIGAAHEGRCLSAATDTSVSESVRCPGAPYQSFPWNKGNGGVDEGCRPYPSGVMCCSLPKDYVAPMPVAMPPPQAMTPAVALPVYVLHKCTGAVKNPCLSSSGGQDCLNAGESEQLVNAVDRLAVITDADFMGLSTFKCAGKCVNGRCRNNKCECDYPFGGALCADRLPTCTAGQTENCISALKFDKIVPGAGQGDTWLIGSTRPITFQVSGYDTQNAQLTKQVEVLLVNKDQNPGCSGFDVTNWVSSGPNAYYSTKVGTVNLQQASRGQASFEASVRVTLTGDKCLTSGVNYAVYLRSVGANGQAARDGPAVYGGPVRVEYASCASSAGAVGNCLSRSACDAMTGWKALTTDALIQSTCNGNTNVCCAPDHTPAASSGSWFRFTSPAPNSAAPYVAGSKIAVQWDFDATRSSSSLFCSVTKDDQFTLQLVRLGGRSVYTLGFKTELVVAELGSYTVSAKKTPGTVDFKATINGESLEEGDYFLMAKVSSSCYWKSRTFQVVQASCQAKAGATVLGKCVPSNSCAAGLNKDETLCRGMVSGTTCCYATRTGMSAGFRDNVEMLDVSASNVVVSLAVIVAALLAL